MKSKERSYSDEELRPLAEILSQQFIHRFDMYPKQLDDGSYVTMHEPLQEQLLYDHLRGDITLGTYLLDQDSQGQFLVLDADDTPDWRRLQAMAGPHEELGAGSYLEKSRRGGHLWIFFLEPTPGKEIREFGRGLLDYFGIDGIELFPKQDELTTGPGSLVRMPFGVHRKTGRRYGFYFPNGEPVAATLREQIQALKGAETLSEPVYERFKSHWSQLERKVPFEATRMPQEADLEVGGDAPVSERIKDAVPVRQFVLRYVELSPSGRGHCPFHDDEHPSFSASDTGWICFAGCGSGSLIDFYMMYQERVLGEECDFKMAVTELAGMLL